MRKTAGIVHNTLPVDKSVRFRRRYILSDSYPTNPDKVPRRGWRRGSENRTFGTLHSDSRRKQGFIHNMDDKCVDGYIHPRRTTVVLEGRLFSFIHVKRDFFFRYRLLRRRNCVSKHTNQALQHKPSPRQFHPFAAPRAGSTP